MVAVAYVRWKIGGKFESHMLMSKTRVVKIKTVNIVRLELAATAVSKRISLYRERNEISFQGEIPTLLRVNS